MQYNGGKHKHGKRIADIINQAKPEIYIEPFCGALNVIRHVRATMRIACDAHGPLIAMWQAAQNGWKPPDSLSESEWLALRKRKYEHDPLVAFAGFGCSFGGKYFAGYARPNPIVANYARYARTAKNGIVRKMADCSDVRFLHCDYSRISGAPGVVIYCDPPYAGTTGYSTGAFDHEAFLTTAHGWSAAGSIVLISEASKIQGAELVAEWHISRRTNSQSGACKKSRELLWYLP